MKTTGKFSVIECQGSPFEIGYQIGSACKESLLYSLEDTLAILSNGYKTTVDDVINTAGKFIENVNLYDPDFIEQLKGQATAIGITFEKMFALRCIFELSLYYNQIQALCTSFAVTGNATTNGKTIIGQNIDWYPRYAMYLLRIRQPNGTTQLSLSLGGMVEYSLSSAGYGMCANSIFTNPQGFKFNLPLGCYLPKVMRQSSFNDAVNLLHQVARGIGYFHLASADGKMVGIESVFDDVEIVKPEKDVLIHTNCYCTEKFKSEDMAQTILPDSFVRRKKMQQLIEKNYGSITPKTMMNILSNHDNSPVSICRHQDPNKPAAYEMKTVASIIMIPEDGVMFIAKGSPCKNEYVSYSVND